MRQLSPRALADILIEIQWQHNHVHHTEQLFVPGFNFWRDLFPGGPLETVFRQPRESDGLEKRFEPDDLAGPYQPGLVRDLKKSTLRPEISYDRLKPGRYYPMGYLTGIPGVFRENVTPFKVVSMSPSGFTADLNHPMAGTAANMNVQVRQRSQKAEERGGSCTDWMEILLNGPGMQAMRDKGRVVYYSGANDFSRRDPSDDRMFYETDRYVHHVDTRAADQLVHIYRQFLKPGDHILDLMAGWMSHLPRDIPYGSVTGIGLNPNEMGNNPQLTCSAVLDLNTDAHLGYADNTFDAAVCSLSVEYLIHPIDVFREVGRVLKPGGVFCVGFSNRWFPEKTIRVWEDLHEFERMGMVLQYFLDAGCFSELSTLSVRGYPRPVDDRYSPANPVSDPIFVVTGRKKQV